MARRPQRASPHQGRVPVFSIQVGLPGCQAVECWPRMLALLICQSSLGGPAWHLVFGVRGLRFSPHPWGQGLSLRERMEPGPPEGGGPRVDSVEEGVGGHGEPAVMGGPPPHLRAPGCTFPSSSGRNRLYPQLPHIACASCWTGPAKHEKPGAADRRGVYLFQPVKPTLHTS